MLNATQNRFDPDYAVHPGEILGETLEARGMKKSDLATRCGLAQKTISQIINGKAPVTSETAIQLERVLGVSASLWNNLESNYRLFTAKISEQREREQHLGWLRKFPVATLKKWGVVLDVTSKAELVKHLLDFFGVASPDAWESYYRNYAVSYRKSSAFGDSTESISTWLRIGMLRAAEIETKPYDKDKFLANLCEIRRLTTYSAKDFEPKLVQFCADAGVAVTFVPELPGTHLSGATLWLTPTKALILLSLRHKTDDQFWFSFFHEACHVLRHAKKDVFIDVDHGDGSKTEEEKEADHFARSFLVPESEYKLFVQTRVFYPANIEHFAQKINIAPGIVVGMLQHDRHIKFSWSNRLKKKFRFIEKYPILSKSH